MCIEWRKRQECCSSTLSRKMEHAGCRRSLTVGYSQGALSLEVVARMRAEDSSRKGEQKVLWCKVEGKGQQCSSSMESHK